MLQGNPMKLCCSVFLLFSIAPTFVVATTASKPNPAYNCRISSAGMASIQLGMTLNQARKAMSTAKFERSSDGEGVALVDVIVGKENLMSLYANEEDSEKAINWQKKISNIETFNPLCATQKGLHPGMLIKDAEKILGKTKKITVSEIEAREYIDFQEQPKNFMIRLDHPPTARVKSNTTQYPAGSTIMSISISQKG